MTLVSDAGGLLVTAVGVGVVAKAVQRSSKKFKKGWGKGYHNHSEEHSINRMKGYSTPRVVIAKVGGKEFRNGTKTKVRYPSQMGGYFYHTYNSEAAAKADIKSRGNWVEHRAKILG